MKLSVIVRKMPQIHAFLASRGAEVLAPTNDYEVLRFRTARGIAVVYRKENGTTTFTGDSKEALTAYFTAGSWSAGNATKRRSSSSDVATMLFRDGSDCFLCLEPLGDDITREHLLAVVHGGPDHIANKVLAHSKCNLQMHHLSLMQKIAMRETNLFRKYGLTVPETKPMAEALLPLRRAHPGPLINNEDAVRHFNGAAKHIQEPYDNPPSH